jgi:hypothetical protein
MRAILNQEQLDERAAVSINRKTLNREVREENPQSTQSKASKVFLANVLADEVRFG